MEPLALQQLGGRGQHVTTAAVEAEGLPTTDRTFVLLHEIPDGGWGWQGEVIDQAAFRHLLPPDPVAAGPIDPSSR